MSYHIISPPKKSGAGSHRPHCLESVPCSFLDGTEDPDTDINQTSTDEEGEHRIAGHQSPHRSNGSGEVRSRARKQTRDSHSSRRTTC